MHHMLYSQREQHSIQTHTVIDNGIACGVIHRFCAFDGMYCVSTGAFKS